MQWTTWVGIGSVLGMSAVALGAFAAHGLRHTLEPAMLTVFQTGVTYHMNHALALLAVGLMANRVNHPGLAIAGWSFLFGILLFSGSLYALALTPYKGLGMVTPFGGIFFLAGWVGMSWAALSLSSRL